MPVLLGDSLFLLFLRLVLGIRNSENGAITKAGLCRGGFIKAGSVDQTIGHLRAAFAGVLGDVSPYDSSKAMAVGRFGFPPIPLWLGMEAKAKGPP